jgi:20S proteasome subunit alpha 5
MTLREAQILALTVLRQVIEEKISAVNIQLATVTMDAGFVLHTPQTIQSLLSDMNNP